MPQPVYATGPDVNTDECQRIVTSLVTVQCMNMNNCIDAQISDIRPAIMLQLSRMTGGNYATACGGYLDGAFNDYVAQYANAAPHGAATAFPNAVMPNPNASGTAIQIPNPLAPQAPDWATDMMERKQELQELQSLNGAGNSGVYAANFPTTYADLSFSERMENAQAGYEPYKDTKVFHEIKIEDEKTYLNRINRPATTTTNNSATTNNSTTTNNAQPSPVDTGSNTPATPAETNTPALITEDIPDEFEALLPWYGILIVKAGSLDRYASLDLPIVSTEYMKSHRDEFFPANSDRALGLRRGCTHSNHTAHDKDVINRAAHKTMGEQDSFWSGSDFYVYDGQDVYWGWATIVGEVVLALLTMGISAEASAAAAAGQAASAGQAAVAGAQTAHGAVAAARGVRISSNALKIFESSSSAIKAVKLTKNGSKIDDAIRLAKAAKSGQDTAAIKSRADAVKALADAGITVKKGPNANTLKAIGRALATAKSTVKPLTWTSSLYRPWRLVAAGVKNIKPTTSKYLGRGATWATRFKTLGVVGGAVGLNYFGRELLKGFGYSSAVLQDPTTGDVGFNSFGLLSDDNVEGRENVISHGTWVQFDAVGGANEDDALNEAMRFAEELTKDINSINASDPLCDVDIYVVQPAISNPEKIPGARSIYYILMNDDMKLKVRTK